MAQIVEVLVGDGADVTVVSLQDWDDDAVHLAHHAGAGRPRRHVQARGGHASAATSSGMDANVEYAGPGGEAELLGLYFADAGQHIEHRLFVDHTAPRTKSNVTYKGALQGQGAHTVWIGNVLIRKVAEGIETYEENRNLVLTDGCRADSVPNLEIETGEIEGAGHASATGRFDDEQLFYLQARGIPEDEARRLVVHGFFADIIRKIGVPEIEERLLGTLEAELAKNVGRDPRAVPDVLRPRLRARRPGRRRRRSRSTSTASRSRSCGATTRSTPSTTSARTPRSPLSEGDVEGCEIECWLHGSRFDLRTGKPSGLPATEPVSDLSRPGRRRRRPGRRRHPAEQRLNPTTREQRPTDEHTRDPRPARHRRHRGRRQGDPQGRRP